jgi:hypothetical protein
LIDVLWLPYQGGYFVVECGSGSAPGYSCQELFYLRDQQKNISL